MKRYRRFYYLILFTGLLLQGVFVPLAAQNVKNKVSFSKPGGFYREDLAVDLGPAGNNLEILYTLDGSEPKVEYLGGKNYRFKNSYAQFEGNTSGELIRQSFQTFVYSGGFELSDLSPEPDQYTHIATSFHNVPQYFPDEPVLKGTVIRARYYNPATNEHGPVVTHTYFISDEYFHDWDLPVISISIQPDELFDFHKGIYVAGKILDDFVTRIPSTVVNGHTIANYKERGDDWERPANFEYFVSTSGRATLNHEIGVRIHGGYSRSYPVKSLRLYARDEYGESHFEHKIFDHRDDTRFKRLILRNAGNDYEFAMFRDGLIHELVRGLNMETQAFQPSILFINGEYWGIHHIRERVDDHYLARNYGMKRGTIDYLTRQYEVEEGSNEHYLSMLEFIRSNDMTSDESMNALRTMMDVDNYIDYLITQIFIGNTDWPANNIDYWREQVAYDPALPKGRDGRWRWVFYDADFGFGLFGEMPNRNSFHYAIQHINPTHSNPLWSTELYRELNVNPQFKEQFSNRFLDLLNTVFLPDRIRSKADSIQAMIEPYIPMHIDRWSSPASVEKWHEHLAHLHYYIRERSTIIRNYLRSRYQLGAAINLTVMNPENSGGRVQVNTIQLPEHTEVWRGIYTARNPVQVKAFPDDGYEFSHWKEYPDSTNQAISVLSAADFTLTPIFKVITSIGEAELPEIPLSTALFQNYPNPFNPQTRILFSLREPSGVRIDVYDLLGNRVLSLVNAHYTPGYHEISLDASGLASGMYVYRMITDTEIFSKKFTVLK